MKQQDDRGQQPRDAFSIDVHSLSGGEVVVGVHCELHGPAIAALRETVADQLSRRPRLLVLDLSDVTATDVDGVAALAAIAMMAGEPDIAFCLVLATGGAVESSLAKAHLTELFEILPSVTAALHGYH